MWTAAREAIRRNDVEALRGLLDEHPELAHPSTEVVGDGFYDSVDVHPLVLACQHGALESASLLIDRGAEVDRQTTEGKTPLYEAAASGQPRLVSLLLAKGADHVARETRYGCMTPLMAAANNAARADSEYVAVIRLLLEDSRVTVNIADDDGWTALYYACMRGHLSRVRVLLYEGGADPQARHMGISALDRAMDSENWDCVRLLQVRRS